MPLGNGADSGMKHTRTRKGADFRLVFHRKMAGKFSVV